MQRAFTSFPIKDLEETKIQMLNWLNQFNIFCFLDNNKYQLAHNSIECVAGAGMIDMLNTESGTALQQLQYFKDRYKQHWMFGHFSYDLKNEIEDLQSNHPDHIQFPDLCFFVPEIVLKLSAKSLMIADSNGQEEKIWNEISSGPAFTTQHPNNVNINARFSKDEYISAVKKLQQHILRGDCYEVNFCQEFYDDVAIIDPLSVFLSLSNASPNPFSAFYKLNDKFLICASPERYLKREADIVYSQPIKGTFKRDLTNHDIDDDNKRQLQLSEKERSENVMVVDLVRNDLSKFCKEGTVSVEELFGIYSFPQVHQMVSTVRGELKPGTTINEMIRASFPMGSMTGAPKKRVMDLIEVYEKTRRGLFSGAVGYFSPEDDFDFNVVIRSILYNQKAKYLSYQAGSAITFYCDPVSEYEECLLKAEAIKKVLTN